MSASSKRMRTPVRKDRQNGHHHNNGDPISLSSPHNKKPRLTMVSDSSLDSTKFPGISMEPQRGCTTGHKGFSAIVQKPATGDGAGHAFTHLLRPECTSAPPTRHVSDTVIASQRPSYLEPENLAIQSRSRQTQGNGNGTYFLE